MFPIAHLLSWRYFLQFKIKLFRVRISAKNVIMTFVATILFVCVSSAPFVSAMSSDMKRLYFHCD